MLRDDVLTPSASIITHEADWGNGLVLRAAHPSFPSQSPRFRYVQIVKGSSGHFSSIALLSIYTTGARPRPSTVKRLSPQMTTLWGVYASPEPEYVLKLSLFSP